ncbi:MAG: DUF3536 domain-containing protein [Gemmatimonadales bacterium]
MEAEVSAAPFHDWNHRIEQECYRTVVAARIPGAEGRIGRIVNTLDSISFNFGPTLLDWLERQAPDTYAAVLQADRRSLERLGFGNAIAMPYHHVILPLSTRRDKETEVRWGIADFRRRFGRPPEGMWLPETAVDPETLDVLAAEGIRFTILAPHQLERRPLGGLPGFHRTTGGGTIAIFTYDGAISHDVAFGPLVRDADQWTRRMLAAGYEESAPELVALATDGETYGHHHKFGEMALARVLERLGEATGARIENFASFLHRHPPEEEVRVLSPTAWSCAHGVERWRSNCGCRIAPERESQQHWRTPLREAVNWLANELHGVYDREGRTCFADPWATRDAYGSVVGAGPGEIRRLVAEHTGEAGDPAARSRATELLELERGALRLFTSCAWFFDDIGGIEAIQVLRYAARAIELSQSEADRLELGFSERLAPAQSNDRALGTGRDIYLARAKPGVRPPARIGAGLAAARRLAPGADYLPGYALVEAGGGYRLVHERTGRSFEFQLELEHHGVELTAVVTSPALSTPERLTLSDLPERARTGLTAAFTAELIGRWFNPEEQSLHARGAESLQRVALRALTRATSELTLDRSPPSIDRARDLIDLYESLGWYVPFDVQTRYYRIRASLPAEEAERLAALAEPMGFASPRAH